MIPFFSVNLVREVRAQEVDGLPGLSEVVAVGFSITVSMGVECQVHGDDEHAQVVAILIGQDGIDLPAVHMRCERFTFHVNTHIP